MENYVVLRDLRFFCVGCGGVPMSRVAIVSKDRLSTSTLSSSGISFRARATTALRTTLTVRPALGYQIALTGFFIGELFKMFFERHAL
jgi:hypothetical protein